MEMKALSEIKSQTKSQRSTKKKQKRMNTISLLILMKTHGIVKMRMRNFLVLQIGKSPVRGIKRLSVYYPERRLTLFFRITDKIQPTMLFQEIATWATLVMAYNGSLKEEPNKRIKDGDISSKQCPDKDKILRYATTNYFSPSIPSTVAALLRAKAIPPYPLVFPSRPAGDVVRQDECM